MHLSSTHGGASILPVCKTLREYTSEAWSLEDHPFQNTDVLGVLFYQAFRFAVPNDLRGQEYHAPSIARANGVLKDCVVTKSKKLVGTPGEDSFRLDPTVGHAVLAFVYPISSKVTGRQRFSAERGRWHVVSKSSAETE